jgi:hypothetical protein
MSAVRAHCCLLCLIMTCLIAGFGCGDDNNGTGPASRPGPDNLFPDQGAVGVPVMTRFSWTYSDSLAGNLFYDVYLGKNRFPSLYRARLADTSIVVGPLYMNQEYYWKVVAYDLLGDTVSSETWRFTTASSFEFPVAIGNRWNYSNFFSTVDHDTLGGESFDTTFGNSTVRISGLDTLSDTVETRQFITSWNMGGSGTAINYRLIRDDGIYLYAYDGTWIGPPKAIPGDGIHYECNGMRFSRLEDLLQTIRNGGYGKQKGLLPEQVIEDPPVLELAYPLEVGHRWTYRDADLGQGWDMQKEVVGIDTLTIAAGTFECFVIRWFWDIDGDGQWDTDIDGYDYISGCGTIMRTFDYPPIYVTNLQGDTVGVSDAYEEFDLLGANVLISPNK